MSGRIRRPVGVMLFAIVPLVVACASGVRHGDVAGVRGSAPAHQELTQKIAAHEGVLETEARRLILIGHSNGTRATTGTTALSSSIVRVNDEGLQAAFNDLGVTATYGPDDLGTKFAAEHPVGRVAVFDTRLGRVFYGDWTANDSGCGAITQGWWNVGEHLVDNWWTFDFEECG